MAQFFNPYDEERAAIERRRQMAMALQQQSQQSIENPMAGGWVVPTQPTQGLAKLAQALLGAYGQRQADTQGKELGEKYRGELSKALKEADALTRGQTAQPEIPIPPDEAGGGPGREAMPGVAPNPQAGALRLLESPHHVAQAVGATQYQKQMEDQRRRAIMKEILGGQGPGQAPSMMGVNPAAAGLVMSGDPALGKLGGMIQDAGKGVAQRPGAPVVNPYTGQIIAPPTPSMAPGIAYDPTTRSASPVPGYNQAAAQTAGAVTGAQEGARAQLDLVAVPDGQGGTIMMPRAMAAKLLGGQQPAAPASAPPASAAPSLQGRSPQEMAAIQQVMAADAQGMQSSVTVPAPSGAPIPSSAVLGRAPSPATQARDKKIAEGEAERTLNQPQARRGVTSAQSKAQTVVAKVDEALERVSGFTTGIPGQVQGAFAGTPAYNLQQSINTIKANLGFQELQAMREASPTGGALGQVAVQELIYLQAAVASLDRGQSPDQLKTNLMQVQQHFNNWKQAVEQSYRATYPGQQPPVLPTPPAPPERRQSDRRGWSVQRID